MALPTLLTNIARQMGIVTPTGDLDTNALLEIVRRLGIPIPSPQQPTAPIAPPVAITTPVVDLSQFKLHPEMEAAARRLLQLAAQQGISLKITEGYRTPERQKEIYEQGRTLKGARRMTDKEVTPALTAQAIKILREHRKDPFGTAIPFEIDGKRYLGVIEQHYNTPGGPYKPWGYHPGVSLFHASPVVSWAKPGNSAHQYGAAIDVVPVDVNGKPIWNDINLWKRIGALAPSAGLVWGGNFPGQTDMPHMQLPNWHRLKTVTRVAALRLFL